MKEIVTYFERIGKPNAILVEYLSLGDLKNKHRAKSFSFEELVRWFQEAHIHFIISHIHQGHFS